MRRKRQNGRIKDELKYIVIFLLEQIVISRRKAHIISSLNESDRGSGDPVSTK